MRVVSGPAAVRLRGLAGHTEIADQSLAGSQLLFVLRNAQRPACRIQTCGVTGIQAMQHCVAPLCGRELRAHVLTEAVPFKGRVVGVLQALRVCQGVDNFHRDFFALCHINDLSGRTVEAVRKKQNLKGGALHIAVKTSLFRFTSEYVSRSILRWITSHLLIAGRLQSWNKG